MGYCYTFYNPEKDFEVIDSGKFVGMPMYQQDFPVKIPITAVTTVDAIMARMVFLPVSSLPVRISSES